MNLFKKSIIVGVSVTPEVGLEVAQVDYVTKTVLKYGVRSLEYNSNQREIADLDMFKNNLQELLMELQIPKDARIVLTIPPALFKVQDYPAAMDDIQVDMEISSDLQEHAMFKESEAIFSTAKLPNSSMQFNKFAYAAVNMPMILEIAMCIKDIGYHLYAIDSSVNATLNSLMYLERVNVQSNAPWVMLQVESYCCRVLSMIGNSYVEVYEERYNIGEVLGDAENYSIVMNAVSPILKNLPSKYLCVVSKTNVISAEILANKLTYSAPITFQEANNFSQEAFLELAPDVDTSLANIVSLDVIAAAIYDEFKETTPVHFNLFNKYLGDVYTNEQPPEIVLMGRLIVLSNENLIKFFIAIIAITVVVILLTVIPVATSIKMQNDKIANLDVDIEKAKQYLKDNENISSDMFDEGDEIRMGLGRNKNIYSYYTIVGTEIPQKLWLTHLKLGEKTTIEGQADNLESVYAFFRSIKDYDPESDIKLQKLSLATNSSSKSSLEDFDTETLLTSLNADFYEFRISNEPENAKNESGEEEGNSADALGLEPIKEN